jgi:thiamine-phosphate pyrophosphorylase
MSQVGTRNVGGVDWSVYLIADRRLAQQQKLEHVVRAAIQGGATVVQLREKEGSTQEMVELGRVLHALTRSAGVPFIVNDRLDVALAIDAEGVHMGQDDMPVVIARRLLGPDRILGVSAGTVAEARQAQQEGADYLGVGDVYGTSSKADADIPIGLRGLSEIAQAVSIPVVGIGGITPQNAKAVIQAGASGVAVISAILGAADPKEAAQRLSDAVKAGRGG